MNITVIDLFCGAGGLTAGFTDHRVNQGFGFQPILALDNNRDACKTYNANFPGDHCIAANIEDWLKDKPYIPKADLIIGGPPCQGFSLLNKQRSGDVRRDLWEPYMDIVQTSDARLFIMENVPGILKGQEFIDITTRAKQLGFTLFSAVLNMADYGIPQTRKRAIIIGAKDKIITQRLASNFPPPKTHRAPNTPGTLPIWRTVKEVIYNLEPPKGVEMRNTPTPYDLHFGRTPTEMSLARYKAVPTGGNRFDLMKNAPEITPKCWLNKPSGSTDLFGRLWWDRPSVTIRTEFFKPEKGRYLHPEQHRPITHREAARIMTFPDKFVFHGNKIEIAKQIGNAVPPDFARYIASYIYRILASTNKSVGKITETDVCIT